MNRRTEKDGSPDHENHDLFWEEAAILKIVTFSQGHAPGDYHDLSTFAPSSPNRRPPVAPNGQHDDCGMADREDARSERRLIMRRWGVVISGFYAVLVASLFWPAVLRLAGRSWPEAIQEVFFDLAGRDMLTWVLVSLLITGQTLLLFLGVDTSWRHAKPRQHIWISAAVVGFFVGLLALAFISCVWVTISEDSLSNNPLSPWQEDWSASSFFGWLLVLWALWGAAFYSYQRGAPTRVASAITWLLRASVLELLVAVPAHVVVRRREDCSAPVVTGFGIATGIAVMLACFGPGVLALYKKRLERYRAAGQPPALRVP